MHSSILCIANIEYLLSKILLLKVSDKFSLEIVGLEDVRIVNEQRGDLIQIQNLLLTLKNVAIYELGNGIKRNTIFITSAKSVMTDVRIHGTKSFAIFIEAGSKVQISRSTFIDCSAGFGVKRSDVAFADCKWKDIDYCSASVNCNITVSRCSLTDIRLYGVGMMGAVNVLFDECEIATSPSNKSRLTRGLDVSHGVQLTMKKCKLSNFLTAVETSDFHTKAVIQETSFYNCEAAFEAKVNSSLSVSDCYLEAAIVLFARTRLRGEIEFRRNVVHFPPTDNMACFCTDGDPESIIHDFDPVFIKKIPKERVPVGLVGAGATAKTRADFKKSCEAMEARHSLPEELNVSRWSSDRVKRCDYCFKGPNEKFNYCSICRVATYCSKLCQNSHWKDHKLSCKKLMNK